MDEGNTALGAGLRGLRKRMGLTQRELVDLACAGSRVSGLVEAGLSHWERGGRVPLPPQLLRLFRVLRPEPEETLILLRTISDYRYAGIIHVLATTGGSPVEQVQLWEHWAENHPLHPPRGQFWADGEEGAPTASADTTGADAV
jgi:transcriptional regulator with XRE-family HTH domain